MRKSKKEKLLDAREAFLKYREEISRELGIFIEEEKEKKRGSYGSAISSRMRAREKKHQRKNK